jgi:tetratricopeptide (TPR) repeat protein
VVHTSTAGLPGRKLFVWGVGPGGDRWQERLSGPGRRYLEIQAGLATTQFEHLALAAGAQVSWTEAIGPVGLAASEVQREWELAGRAVEAALADRLPAREVEDAHRHWLTSVADREPGAPMHRGSRFGAAELAIRGMPADHDAATPFANAEGDGSDQPLIPPVSPVWQPYFENRPRSWWASLMRAIRAHAGGELAAARSHYQESLALQPSMIARRGLALIAAAEGDDAAAAEGYLAAVALDPHCRALLVEAIDALLVAGRAATALELIAAAPPKIAGHGRVVLQQIRALLAVGDRTAAARLLQQGIDVPDLREGESIEAVWRLACPGVDLPSRYDFRMHAAQTDPSW